MLTLENVEITGWEAAIRGMRNPKNSWDKSDSYWTHGNVDTLDGNIGDTFFVGENDLKLMKTLANAGTDHGKFLRMITVTLDINAPLYWWKEYDTYKVGTVANSCSTMHKIDAKEFELDDFSHEHLRTMSLNNLTAAIRVLNHYRILYLDSKEKTYWWQLIQLLPSSYNQRRTVQLNYAVLRNIYHARRHHKLDEWHTLCDWIEGLPHAELITGDAA